MALALGKGEKTGQGPPRREREKRLAVCGEEERGESMAFGKNLQRLDEVLRRLESDPMSLDEALDAFEQGVSLVRENRRILEEAEQRVAILTREGTVPFEARLGDAGEKNEEETEKKAEEKVKSKN